MRKAYEQSPAALKKWLAAQAPTAFSWTETLEGSALEMSARCHTALYMQLGAKEVPMRAKFMNNAAKLLALGAFLNSPIQAMAVQQWMYTLHPKNIRTNASFVSFSTAEAIPGGLGCSNNDFYVVPSSADSKAALSVLLTAYALGSTIEIFVNGCDTNTGRPLVTDVLIN